MMARHPEVPNLIVALLAVIALISVMAWLLYRNAGD